MSGKTGMAEWYIVIQKLSPLAQAPGFKTQVEQSLYANHKL